MIEERLAPVNRGNDRTCSCFADQKRKLPLLSIISVNLNHSSNRPHPFEQLAAWLNLTNCITDSVLER